jgi:transposase InsO family protein
MEEIKRELIQYIKYYNNDRIKHSLNWLSPVNYRKAVA